MVKVIKENAASLSTPSASEQIRLHFATAPQGGTNLGNSHGTATAGIFAEF
jgi:hypothetical protein